MAKKYTINNKSLKLASQFRDLLLYQLMGDNIGKKPEFPIPASEATFAEKKGLYAELLKHAQIELKIEEDQPEQSGLDIIRRSLNGSRASRGARDHGGTESDRDDSLGTEEASSDA